MNRSDFINMLEDKVQVNRRMIGEVIELIDIFPYFQSAHMLLLKGLQTSADVKFEKQLRNSAIHIADREVLYYLLNRKTVALPSGDETTDDAKTGRENGSDSQQNVIETAKNSDQLISEIEKNTDALPGMQSEDTLLHHSHSILISSETETPEPEEVMLVMDEEPAMDEDRVFYMDPGFAMQEYNDLLELDTEPGKVFSAMENEVTEDQTGVVKPSDKKLLQLDLIDKFILANPRIEPAKDPAKIPQGDISKPITDSEGAFVTETLARIYINQGYYSKAIDIYEQLSLKFPEKSSYFASQIELVKVHLKK